MEIDIFPRIRSLKCFEKSKLTVPQRMLMVKRIVGRNPTPDLSTLLHIMSKYEN